MVDCPNCGADVGKSKFCPECGTKIEEEKPKSVCPNCGYDDVKSKFCPECGTKIEEEKPKSLCPSCGADVGKSKFCSECGTPVGGEKPKKTCPDCGKSLKDDAKFCPYCGWSESKNDPKSTVDKIIDTEENISSRFGSILSGSKTVDSVLDKTISLKTKHMDYGRDSAANRVYFEKIEPVFLEVYDAIDDGFLREIFMLERMKHDNQGGGLIGMVATKVNTPTSIMSHDEAIGYYTSMVNRLQDEINQEKQNGTFDEDEFYKRKVKESSFENMNSLSGLKFLKSR